MLVMQQNWSAAGRDIGMCEPDSGGGVRGTRATWSHAQPWSSARVGVGELVQLVKASAVLLATGEEVVVLTMGVDVQCIA